jgi:DNA processing protein
MPQLTNPSPSSVSTSDKINWLRLCRSEKIGPITFFRLLKAFGSVDEAIKELPIFSKNKLSAAPIDTALRELELAEKFGAKIITFCDQSYPKLLREIANPAPVLTIKGDIDFFQNNLVAVVGARNASLNSISFAKKLALDLGQNSITTVSGMARGIDAAVHSASILSGTIGVVAGGIDHIYPRENCDLFEQVAAHGLLISENAFGAKPLAGNFVQRNRLISGLSLAVVIIEAGLKSGSLVTARFAAEQGREVFAVPGSPFDLRCQGSNRLIKDGANMFETVDDILEEIPQLKRRAKEIAEDSEPLTAMTYHNSKDDEISKTSQEILRILSFSPTSIDDLISELHLPSNLVNAALVRLELAEKITNNLGKVVLKT